MKQRTIQSNWPQQPHGGTLVQRVLTGSARQEALNRSQQLARIIIDQEAIITLEMIATGVLSPNEGFMTEADYNAVLDHGRLANGLIWPVPLSFAPTGNRNSEVIESLSVGDEVVLSDIEHRPIAILRVDDIFAYDKDRRAQALFGTTHRSHPGVDAIYRRMGDVALGGPIQLLNRADWGPFEKLRLEPIDTWNYFYNENDFESVGGFITGANPLHRGHEYIHRNALENLDGLLVQPLVELAKREYTRHEYRVLAYRSVMDTYYPERRAKLAPLRVTYIFAGPRETVLHALIMKNYGCTDALIGRDHAGVGDFYDKYESHSIFDEFTPEEMGIQLRLFHEVFYCSRCSALATERTCPHDIRYRINISGTGIRELLRYGFIPPKEIIRPESARIAIQGIQPKGLDESGEAVKPIGKTIQSIFPYYPLSRRIGHVARNEPLPLEQLTIEDLEDAIFDVRLNANKIYQDIFEEFCYTADTNRSLQPEWRSEARVMMKDQQEMVISDLEEKLLLAPTESSDEFMYQDFEEVEKELEVAKRIASDIPKPLHAEDISYRTWNPLPYSRYRMEDDE